MPERGLGRRAGRCCAVPAAQVVKVFPPPALPFDVREKSP